MKVNAKWQIYKKNRLLGMTKYSAAILAGYSHNTAKNAKLLLDNRMNFDLFLETQGLTDKLLAEKTIEGLNATKIEKGIGEFPDFAVRHKYLETTLKARNKIKNPETNIDQRNQIQNITYVWADTNPVQPPALPAPDTRLPS